MGLACSSSNTLSMMALALHQPTLVLAELQRRRLIAQKQRDTPQACLSSSKGRKKLCSQPQHRRLARQQQQLEEAYLGGSSRASVQGRLWACLLLAQQRQQQQRGQTALGLAGISTRNAA